MKLLSPAFQNNMAIPAQFTCDGTDFSPPLEISDVPISTQSLALIVDDPDAPSGNFVHWLVWNISPETKMINENSVSENAVQGTTGFGKTGWGGPCPPSGVHHYQFKLFALNIHLNLSQTAQKKDLQAAMIGHVLEEALLVGTYQRK